MTKVAASQNIAERSMNVFWKAYEAGDMEPSVELLRSLGYTSLTLDYVFNPDTYYFPNMRGQRFVKPKNIDDDRIPVMAITRDGSEFWPPLPEVFHGRQKEILLESGHSTEEINAIDVVFSKLDLSITRPGGRSTGASVLSTHLLPGEVPDIGKNLAYRSKPAVLIYTSDYKRGELLCPTAQLHELTHVAQNLDRPYFREYKPLDMELEAYAAQAKLLFATTIDYSDFLALAASVDNFRKYSLGKDIYTSTPEFEQETRMRWPQILPKQPSNI